MPALFMGALWWPPKVANHEAPEQRKLSALECDFAKGQQGPLGSMSYGNGELSLGSVLEGGCRMGEGRRSEIRGAGGACEQRVELEQRHGVTL